jgi:L-ascorbate metabolism protein UlaG (beta-lactamase superfamily)
MAVPGRVGAERVGFGIAVLGGPTTVVDLAGSRLVVDPTFDPPGDKGYLTKLRGPATSEADLGPVDAVLVSHDLHPDNLDDRGRAFALAAPLLVTGPRSAGRLGPAATPLAAWETVSLPRGDRAGDLTIRAVPAMHGPVDGARDEAVTSTARSPVSYCPRTAFRRCTSAVTTPRSPWWSRWPGGSGRSTWPCCSSERRGCRARSAAVR